MIGRENVAANFDRPILIMYLLLMFMGWANIYSAAYDPEHANIFDQSKEYGKQAVWMAVSLTLGAGILLIRGELFREMAFGIYGFVILLLVAVLLFGKEVNGAKAWFAIGGFGIQPAEFAKFATALALSRYLSGLKALVDTRSRVISTAIILFPVTLIMLQPDTGTALVSGAFILVLYREGLSGNVLLLGILAAVLSILSLILKESSFDLPFTDKVLTGQYFLFALITVFTVLAWWLVRNLVVKRMRKRLYGLIVVGFISSAAFIGSVDYAFEKVLATHQRDRILVMLGQKEDPQGLGYNVKQSQTAIGSGGFAGKGYLDGTLTKFKYVPMQSTDFIFCTVGEEWGFIGSAFVVILLTALILRIIQISDRQRSRFTRIYAYCVASIFFLHLMINVGMTIGLAPVIGIPLPFFSYGGSSMISFTILLGILLRLDAERLSQLR
ncbi:MAG: rod shape-determining protein RodA [Flavobacteriales bacterium]|jgi:rod shape determining protein RodA|nr:rod shape-determining protein RodA [Flavobacteriales bacterium]MBK6884834.1 rod shape-determining protein RodA [Flavobacteriales bacterium]MBK7102159.1 rod shape-determining protein RodA [Flavobacteriales bacterium]MBK7620464.1 rod shape-determining protein RodA [Flavobacteriales bacterium]MBK8531449.1 rod shape-determining protein RodA [Flavobacteriales bacterium]